MELEQFQKEVGLRIRKAREAQGVDRKDLVKHGLTYSYLSELENGKKNATLDSIRKVCKGIGTNGSSFFDF